MIPSYKCKEVAYIISLTGLLVLRTIMSIWLSDVNGNIVKAIVAKNLPDFFKRVQNLFDNFVDFYTVVVCSSIFSSELRTGLLH